eukprot:gene14157-16681_t
MLLAPATGPYDTVTHVHQPIWYVRRYTLGVFFDETKQRTYYCDVAVHRLNKIPQVPDDRYTGAMDLYDSPCNFLGTNGDDLYLVLINYGNAGTTTRVYRGNVNCVGCKSDTLTLVAELPILATDFSMTSTHFYFSAAPAYGVPSGGLIQLPISGDMVAVRYYTSDPIQNFVIDSTASFAYYLTTDNLVKKVSLPGNHAQTTLLLDSNTSGSGTCGCAEGFTGPSCATCEGQVRWTNGVPQCIPHPTEGASASCTEDWHCPNLPFSLCDKYRQQCSCQSGFTGPTCGQCEGQILWTNGIPSCK